ncbi:MAG: ABC transporter permease [Gemmatimonadales bacterium]|nr:ABC transporter permease [Gemmatimonadales bacterium]
MDRESLRRHYGRFFGADPERDVDDELAFHRAMRAEEFQRAGMTPAEAEEEVRRRFGSLAAVRDECRQLARRRLARQRRTLRLDALAQDLRFALRMIAANPGFSLIVALTLAMGIGANTAVFSVAYGVLLRPLPYPAAESLARLWSRNTVLGLEFFSVSAADYQVWRGQRGVFSAMGAFERQREATLVRGDQPEVVQVTAVTADLFTLLGVAALYGRTFLADDARPGAAAAVIDHALWTSRLGSDSSVIGRELGIDGRPYTVVGIMPPRFSVPGTPAQIWTALSLADASGDHGHRDLRVLARLAPGMTLDRARLQMDLIAGRLARQYPATNQGWSVNMMSVADTIVGAQFRSALLALLGVVGFVLLIACANSANLQLARAAARRREIALRAALGATRGRLTAQLLTESALLGLIAGIGGLALAYGGIRLLHAVGGDIIPRLHEVRLDGPALAFSTIVALGSGLLFGLLPALGASRSDIGAVLKEAGRGDGQAAVGQRVLATLVISQVSLSLILLVGAGLLLRSFYRLQSVDTGFAAAGVVAIPIRLPEESYPDSGRVGTFYEALLERVRQLPGVAHAAAVSSAPFAGPNSGNTFFPEGRAIPPGDQVPDADYRTITPGYLRTLGIRLLQGRDFSSLDHKGAPRTALISNVMARRYWPNGNPVGRRFRFGDPLQGSLYTIVGVIADVRYQSLETLEVRPMMYFSALADPQRAMTVVVRGGSGTLKPALRQVTATLDPLLPPPVVNEMDDLVGAAMATPRFALLVFAAFAGVALLLAAIGIYGVMSYLVRQRAQELGVKIALGAPPHSLVASVVGRALTLTLIGVAIGLAGAWGLTRLISSLLFGVSATDLPTFAGIALLLTVVALAASLGPARRAALADPLLALRRES